MAKSLSQARQDLREERQLALNRRVRLWKSGQIELPSARPVERSIDGVSLKPRVKGLDTRAALNNKVTREGDRIISNQEFLKDGIKKLEPLGLTIAQKTDDANQTYRRLWGIIQPEYNLLEPFTIFDSEPFVRQAINRKISLMFRNGFEITGDQDPDIQYIQRRFEAMEYVMERTTESFFKQILFNLLLCSNCFLQKIRNEKATIVSQKENGPVPVAGYRLIPAHMIFPYMENGIPVKWRRFFDTGAPFEDISLEDIIHLKWDVKPGHRYGTPRTVGVRDDLFALRRLEENVELLFINFLFPLFHVAVGNDENPAGYDSESGMSEVDLIHWQIQNMPKEGVFVTDERVKVTAVGAEGKALDYSKLMEHYKSRIYTGLGMSAVDMGDAKTAGSRSTADNISQNLKDSIKSDLETFGGMVRMSIFKEFFLEATYSVSVQKAVARTWLHFHEIDLDNKIKFENHVIQLYLNNLVDEDEARQLIGKKKFQEVQRKKLNFDLHTVRLVKETEKAKADTAIKVSEAAAKQQEKLMPMQTEHAEKQAKTQAKLSAVQTSHHERKAAASIELLKAKTEHAKGTGAGRPQSATAKKSSPGKKAVQNKETPTNQHGSNLGPTKAKSGLEKLAAEWTDAAVELIEQLKDSNGTVDHEAYQKKVGPLLESILARVESEIGDDSENSYTRQARTGLDQLRTVILTTYDPELISVLVTSALDGTEVEDARVSDASSDSDS
jgi:hypothetical protein